MDVRISVGIFVQNTTYWLTFNKLTLLYEEDTRVVSDNSIHYKLNSKENRTTTQVVEKQQRSERFFNVDNVAQ